MVQFFFLCLLFIYYWYFYASFTKPVAMPLTELLDEPQPFDFEFKSKQPNHFEFVVNGNTVWEHELPVDTFAFYKGKILATDPCYRVPNGYLVEAKGKYLYEYLQENPESKNDLNFINDSQFTIQNGSVFYFECLQNRIEKLGMCPSGTIFKINSCQPVNPCTDQPNGTLLPHPIINRYFECINGLEKVLSCPKDTIFNHGRCEPIRDLNHYCKHFSAPLILDDKVTLVECVNKKPVYTTCKPGMKFINNNYCEPSDCDGLPDDAKIPLPEKEMKPFKFSPGYMICRNNRIQETVECPQNWDEKLSYENLLFLPMVYDKKSETCSIPKFCENVFSDDPDIVVPSYNHAKNIKNFKWSMFFDHSVGFYCQNNTRKRKVEVETGMIISKRFKIESACGPNMPRYLPLYNFVDDYYDCDTKEVLCCRKEEDNKYFNGKTCADLPKNYVDYEGLPLFRFDSLNFEGWIKPWDYSKDNKVKCNEPESKFLELYNICSHPDCEKYAFVSHIPNMAILLPREQRAKCKFYESEHALKKEPVDFDYHFWIQKVVDDIQEKPCKPGQKLETGNFVWDTTIFATCNMNQPFVFCPSKKTKNIIPTSNGFYACEPPVETHYTFDKINEWAQFEKNEIKQILPLHWDNEPHYIQINKSKKKEILTQNGLDIPEGERINLFTNKPVLIEPRIRVTHPPNVAFEYGNDDTHTHVSTPDHGYLTKLKSFTNKALSFPKYVPESLMDGFEVNLYV